MIKIKDGKIGYKETLLYIGQLEIAVGTLTALIGKNGSGKSTFLKSLCGVIPTLGGNFTIENKAIGSITESELSRMIAFVGSTQVAIPYLSVTEYVLLGRSPYTGLLGRYHHTDFVVAEGAIELFNLSEKKDCGLTELSDGERQLAAFSRAFAQDTPVILMDEPTAFLDYGNKRTLLSILKKASQLSHKSVIISTHDLDRCVEEEIGIMGIDSRQNQMKHYPQGTTKEILLKEFF